MAWVYAVILPSVLISCVLIVLFFKKSKGAFERFLISVHVLYLAQFIFTFIGALQGCITYGGGLGDLGLLIVQGIVLLFALIFFGLVKRYLGNGKKGLLFQAIISGLLLYLMVYWFLLMTYWRGAEMPWDGNVFIC